MVVVGVVGVVSVVVVVGVELVVGAVVSVLVDWVVVSVLPLVEMLGAVEIDSVELLESLPLPPAIITTAMSRPMITAIRPAMRRRVLPCGRPPSS